MSKDPEPTCTPATWTVTLYRDDSTTPVVFEDVKHIFWTAGNSVLVIAQLTEGRGNPQHHYVQWPRERFCWFKVARVESGGHR